MLNKTKPIPHAASIPWATSCALNAGNNEILECPDIRRQLKERYALCKVEGVSFYNIAPQANGLFHLLLRHEIQVMKPQKSLPCRDSPFVAHNNFGGGFGRICHSQLT